MFSFFRKKADVLSHWYVLVENFKLSSQDFYNEIETALKEREVPGLGFSKVEFSEGGLLSANRIYLRMVRERLVFDVCAAPFGTGFFFSCRFAEIPAVITVWQLIVVFAGLFLGAILSFFILSKLLGVLGLVLFPFALIVGLFLMIYVMRNAVSMGLRDLDASLIKSPVLGPIYENWFRKETYYRHDTRLMYCDTVNSIVKTRVEETTGSKGIKLVRFNEFNPVLSDLYKPTIVALPKEPS